MAVITNPNDSNHKVDTTAISAYNKIDFFDSKINVGGYLTTGSAVVDLANAPELSAIAVGMTVKGNGIPASTTVLSKTATTVTLSNTATITGGSSLTIGGVQYILSFQTGSAQTQFNYGTGSSAQTARNNAATSIGW